ncbi:2-succinyl-5-enolpyruvyl-6-hydroxy-3-cyclohexene-1-carboxylate synthase [Gossypium arboreum]|uniref:2-succinyl-5-enolpyruvyl-6-hydroxy-3-cyclohexene-1-carboxylate synthase n=1 Tax=Gossypium arboreum TaxID=29729 RepID=A0A0B0PBE7_GOSAR|nr:2-succinyl-5-enolpyruvyl-6-hydroxy-3-cyclohexene-1-carboxylate synthase [Gossypium arboreum]
MTNQQLWFSPNPNLISLVLDLNIFKLNSFKHILTQFSPKSHKWVNYHFTSDILYFLQFSPNCTKHKHAKF